MIRTIRTNAYVDPRNPSRGQPLVPGRRPPPLLWHLPVFPRGRRKARDPWMGKLVNSLECRDLELLARLGRRRLPSLPFRLGRRTKWWAIFPRNGVRRLTFCPCRIPRFQTKCLPVRRLGLFRNRSLAIATWIPKRCRPTTAKRDRIGWLFTTLNCQELSTWNLFILWTTRGWYPDAGLCLRKTNAT